MLIAALSAFVLVMASGCQQKGSAGNTGESAIQKRASDAANIVKDSQKRVHDSLKQVKEEAKNNK